MFMDFPVLIVIAKAQTKPNWGAGVKTFHMNVANSEKADRSRLPRVDLEEGLRGGWRTSCRDLGEELQYPEAVGAFKKAVSSRQEDGCTCELSETVTACTGPTCSDQTKSLLGEGRTHPLTEVMCN